MCSVWGHQSVQSSLALWRCESVTIRSLSQQRESNQFVYICGGVSVSRYILCSICLRLYQSVYSVLYMSRAVSVGMSMCSICVNRSLCQLVCFVEYLSHAV